MKNIVIAEFKLETNRFTPGLTDEQAYRNRNLVFGEEMFSFFKGVKNETGAFLDVFSDKTDCRLIPSIGANAMPGPVASADMFRLSQRTILETIRKTDVVDGVLLSLHGAMVTEEFDDGEGVLLESIRAEVGPDVPIIATLDLHANITQLMIDNADALFVYDYYPHIDLYETGVAAANAMYATVTGKVKPTMRWHQIPFLQPMLPTELPALKQFVDKQLEMRKLPGVLRVNIASGFFYSDIEELGLSVVAVTDNDVALAQSLADQLSQEIWDMRKELKRKLPTPDEAIDIVMASGSEEGPFVLADVADNPGAGGSCDSTGLLRRLIERNIPNAAFAIIYDPETVLAAEKAGVGNTFTASIGGKSCPEICGEPVVVTAYVKSISDGVYVNQDAMGKGVVNRLKKSVVLVVGELEIIVASNRVQPWDLEVYRIHGITPERKKVLVTKSTAHFRNSFGPIAYQILDVESPALAPQNPEMLAYQHCRRPVYPLDDIE